MATDIQERALADSQFGGGATTWAPATWYMGLSLTIPNDDGTNFTEPVGGAYARTAVVNNTTNFPAAATANGVTTKTIGSAITFPNPTANWGLILYWGFFTLSSGDTVRYFNPLDTAITVLNGNTPVQFAAGQLILPWE